VRPAPSGRRLPLPGGREAVFHFDEVRVGPRTRPAPPFALPLSVPGRVELPDGTSLSARPAKAVSKGAVAVGPEPLLVRTRRPGDRIRAKGREMSLKRFLMDRRIPVADRGRLPLVAAGNRIVWVAGQPAESASEPGLQYVRVALRAARRAE